MTSQHKRKLYFSVFGVCVLWFTYVCLIFTFSSVLLRENQRKKVHIKYMRTHTKTRNKSRHRKQKQRKSAKKHTHARNYRMRGGERFKPNNRDELDEAIMALFINKTQAEARYGVLGTWDVTKITNMGHLFADVGQMPNEYFEGINEWDVSPVRQMYGMFETCRYFNQPLDQWNVSRVTHMSNMFYKCNQFNQNLNNWNVSQVTNMNHMFSECFAYDQPMYDWDVGQVEHMIYMFSRCSSFNQDINTWDTGAVRSMGHMFEKCSQFDQPLNDWNVSQVTDMNCMFLECFEFNQNLNMWDVSSVEDMGGMFGSCVEFNGDVHTWDVSSVTNMNGMFFGCTVFGQDLSHWDVQNVEHYNDAFEETNMNPADLPHFSNTGTAPNSHNQQDSDSDNGYEDYAAEDDIAAESDNETASSGVTSLYDSEEEDPTIYPDPPETATCFDFIEGDQTGIRAYLEADPANFVVGIQRNPSDTLEFSCNNLNDLKAQFASDTGGTGKQKYQSFFACKDDAPAQVQGSYTNYVPPYAREFVKLTGPAGGQYLTIKPRWVWRGPVPAPRVFLLQPGGQINKFITNQAFPQFTPGFNFVGADHCNQTSPQTFYTLKPYVFPAAPSGGAHRRRPQTQKARMTRRKPRRTNNRSRHNTHRRRSRL